MARIDGIIILDTIGCAGNLPVPDVRSAGTGSRPQLTNRKPLITSHFAHQPPSYASVHVDAYNHHSKQASASSLLSETSLPAVLWVNTLTKAASTSGQTGSGGAGLCHVQREGLKFLVPLGEEGELAISRSALQDSQS